MSDQPKPAFLAEIGNNQSLKHVEAPKESLATSQAKILLEVKGEKNLKHVEAPKDGVSEAVKQAYLEEKKGGAQ